MRIIAGVDEVGRGSLIGPVFAAAVILKTSIPNIKDSKKLSAAQRLKFYNYIRANSYFAVGSSSLEEIKKLNILYASLLAMQRAVENLAILPEELLIEGAFPIAYIKNPECKITSIIKGDEKIPEIAAASIIAKVLRDELITKLHMEFPNYGWDKNKGYGTKYHIKAIYEHGVSRHHRATFAPMKNMLNMLNMLKVDS